MTGRGHEARRQRRRENVPPGCPTRKQIMKRIAVLTSGGGAPGLKAPIWGGVRTGPCRGGGGASTIDNDLYGSDISIGVDTALNIALEAVDRLKTTASSHQRAFLVEVMGRDCGYLALMAGLAGGADPVVTP